MSKRWYHEVSEDWMRQRQLVLTATDIAKLLPEYKRMQKKQSDPGTIIPGFAALWAEKATGYEPDTSSVGKAARGHIFEPWAVEAWNRQVKHQMYHWDDVVICNGGVGFSPDAMDVECKATTARMDVMDNLMVDQHGVMQECPGAIVEIKSYAPAHHMKCCLKDKFEQDELLQVAVPFVVFPHLVQACLVFFCPEAPISMKAFAYTRKDLATQIEVIEDIAKVYRDNAELCMKFAAANDQLEAGCTEQEIWEDFLQSQAENFVGDGVFDLKG